MTLSRQELYDRIKATSKDAYILSEMKRLGFWDQSKPSIAGDLLDKRSALETEIAELARQVQDPEAALKAIHTERMAAARERRQETKIKREFTRYNRALNWHQSKQSQIDTLGDAAHFNRNGKSIEPERLQSLGLPVLETAAELAEQAGVTLNEIRFLTYARKVSKISHYQRFEMAKKTGGTRVISAPMPRLKRLQYWILEHLLTPLAVSEQAHGFVAQRSIVSNAQPHSGQQVVINFDLEDFFPSISYPRVKGLFSSLGYGDKIATLLTLICTEADTTEVELDGERYFLAGAVRRLPQGAPTSPMISNLLCRRLDKRLQGLATKLGFAYTRYADDLSFSAADDKTVCALLKGVKTIVSAEGFKLHPNKTRVMRKGQRHEVTGLVVNQQPAISRKTLKQFRALLFQIQNDGLSGKYWGLSQASQPSLSEAELLLKIEGFAHYVKMVDAEKGKPLVDVVKQIRKQSGIPRPRKKETHFRFLSVSGSLPLDNQRVAQPPEPPKVEDLIQHRDVLEPLKAKLATDALADVINHAQGSEQSAASSPEVQA